MPAAVKIDATEFWEWFTPNRETIALGMQSNDQETVRKTLGDVDERLQKVAPGVSFLYGRDDEGHEFVATANGIRERVPYVIALIESATMIEGWKFTAFRPPSDGHENFRIEMGDLSLAISDVSFRAFDLGDKGLGITLYPEGMTDDRRDLYANAAITLMDHIIGEYEAIMMIDSLCVDPLSSVPDGSKTIPLSELQEFLREVRGVNDP